MKDNISENNNNYCEISELPKDKLAKQTRKREHKPELPTIEEEKTQSSISGKPKTKEETKRSESPKRDVKAEN